MEGWEGYREGNFPKLEQASKSGGGVSSDNLMALANILSLEDLVAKCNMDIFKLQEDCNIAKDQMKAMEDREKAMEKKQKNVGNSDYFGIVEMCKWWLKKFSNGVVARDLSKIKMGNKNCIINYSNQLWSSLMRWEKKHYSQAKKLLIETL
jgi:hypothetical protein